MQMSLSLCHCLCGITGSYCVTKETIFESFLVTKHSNLVKHFFSKPQIAVVKSPKLNEQPSILNEQPSILNEQPSILNEQPSILNEQPSILKEQACTTITSWKIGAMNGGAVGTLFCMDGGNPYTANDTMKKGIEEQNDKAGISTWHPERKFWDLTWTFLV
jgi:hypothetical protein